MTHEDILELHPVYTSITGEQARKILCIGRPAYLDALRSGVLERNGMAQCDAEFSPRLHNIVDISIYGSILNFGWPNKELDGIRDYCFSLFDVILEEVDLFEADWYVQIVNKSGQTFENILKMTPTLLDLTDCYISEYDIYAGDLGFSKLRYNLHQTCIDLFGVCGVRTSLLFEHLSSTEGLSSPMESIETCLKRALTDPLAD